MNSVEVFAVSEFRRFINKHVYPITVGYFLEKINYYCETEQISFDTQPRPVIKFVSRFKPVDLAQYTTEANNIIREIFISYFNEESNIKLITNKIYTEESNIKQCEMLYEVLSQIRQANPVYLNLLFNVTVLNDSIYLYL